MKSYLSPASIKSTRRVYGLFSIANLCQTSLHSSVDIISFPQTEKKNNNKNSKYQSLLNPPNKQKYTARVFHARHFPIT